MFGEPRGGSANALLDPLVEKIKVVKKQTKRRSKIAKTLFPFWAEFGADEN